MAGERSIIRRIVSVFDRKSADQAQGEMVQSLAKSGEEGGKKAGQNFLRDLRAEFNKRKAELAEQLARGTIDQKEFKKQTDIAAKTFNDGLLKGIEEARRQGKLTDAEYTKLTRSIKRVGDEGQRHIGGRLVDALKKAAVAAAALFGLRQIQRFGREALRAGEAIAAGQRALEQQLANTGVAWANVRGEIRDTARALWDTHRLTAGEVDQTLRQLIVVTNDYELSLRSVGLTHDIMAATGLGAEQAARLLGRALNGDITVFRRYGVEIDETRDVLEQLTERFGGAAKASTTATEVLTKAWSDFKEQVGLVMLEAADGASIFDTLTDAIRAMTDWVERNTQAFVQFFNLGIVPVARGLWMVVRAVMGVAKVFVGVLFGVLAAGAHGLSLVAQAAALAERAKARFLGLFSAERAAAANREADAILAHARALREWARAAEETARETILEGLFPGIPERPGGRPERAGPTIRTPIAGWEDAEDAARGTAAYDEAQAAADREAEALARLEAQREALIQQMLRDIEVSHRRAAASLEGEEAVEALNRQLHIEEALLRANAEAGTEFADTIADLAGQQYDAARAAEEAARTVETAWTEALDAIEAEVQALGSTIHTLFSAWSSGGIEGLVRVAKAKVAENLARAAENFAKAWGWVAGLNPAGAAAAKKAAVGHLGAAAKWGAVGGVSAGMRGGGGGASFGGGSVPSMTQAGGAQPAGPEVHIYFDGPGFDAVNPHVQRVIAGASKLYGERYGPNANVTTHRRKGGG